MAKQYETVIGLEVHVELATRTKIFCGCTTKFGGEPNTNCCPICIGLPGTLSCRLQPNHAEGHGWDENSACNPLRLVVNYCSLNKGWSSAAAAKGRRHPWLQEHL